jgi:hypothetical protein
MAPIDQRELSTLEAGGVDRGSAQESVVDRGEP